GRLLRGSPARQALGEPRANCPIVDRRGAGVLSERSVLSGRSKSSTKEAYQKASYYRQKRALAGGIATPAGVRQESDSGCRGVARNRSETAKGFRKRLRKAYNL